MHAVFKGPPGTGKTTVARLLGKLYKAVGILDKGHVVEVDRGGLVAGYIGHTTKKTTEKLEEALGGILFIDEAYSLGDPDKKDHYSREAIDILVAYLTEQKENFVCVLAGYKQALDECFFNFNEGLER